MGCRTVGCSTLVPLADVDVDPDELSGVQLLALNACAQEFGMQDDDLVRCVLQSTVSSTCALGLDYLQFS